MWPLKKSTVHWGEHEHEKGKGYFSVITKLVLTSQISEPITFPDYSLRVTNESQYLQFIDEETYT
jgi:hypothetical protein